MNYEAFYKISYGLYVICTEDDGKKNGYIGNTAFQVTAEPPQIAISCSKNNFTTEMILNSGFFSVSVLDESAGPKVIGKFGYMSGSNVDKFEAVEYKTGKTGVPIVTEFCTAYFECKVVQEVDLGTHIFVVGEVVESELLESEKDPMTYAYYRNVKRGVAPKNAPTHIDKSKLGKG